MFDFEKLEVYNHLRLTVKKVLAFLNERKGIDPYLSDQLRRASVGMLLSLSEGTGRIVNSDKKELYTSSRSSAFEAVTIVQLLRDLEMMTQEEYEAFYADFETASKMLLGMIRSFSG